MPPLEVVLRRAADYLLAHPVEEVTDTRLQEIVRLPNRQSVKDMFTEKVRGVSFVSVAKRRIIQEGWRYANSIADEGLRKANAGESSGLLDLLEVFLGVTLSPRKSAKRTFILFLLLHSRTPSKDVRSQDLEQFNQKLDGVIRAGQSRGVLANDIPADCVREAVFGAFSEMIYMHYLRTAGIAPTATSYELNDIRVAMECIIRGLTNG